MTAKLRRATEGAKAPPLRSAIAAQTGRASQGSTLQNA
jgi:hypothetical protein